MAQVKYGGQLVWVKDVGQRGLLSAAEVCRTPVGEAVACRFFVRGPTVDAVVERTVVDHLKADGHPNVLQLRKVFLTATHLGIVSEHVEGRTLFDALKETRRFGEAAARAYFQQLTSAALWCHSQGVTFDHLRLESVLVSGEGSSTPQAKIAEFGYSTRDRHSGFAADGRVREAALTPAYTAPEALVGAEELGTPADVWTLGVMLFTLVGGAFPFIEPTDPHNVPKMVQRTMHLQFSIPLAELPVSASCRDLLARMLVPDPHQRVSLSEVLAHPWCAEGLPLELQEGAPPPPKHCSQTEAEVRALIQEARQEKSAANDDDFESLEQYLAGLRMESTAPTQPSMQPPAAEDLALTHWRIDFEELELGRCIGSGSFAKVYLAKWRETNVAAKMLGMAWLAGTDALNELRKEATLLLSMRHPNCVQMIGVCLEPAVLVTEYCSRGSLYDILQRARSDPRAAAQLGWARRLNLALGAAKGMLYLHNCKPPIIHRDLKSPNLLVDDAWRCKVADFNTSRVLESGTRLTAGGVENPRWLAPEMQPLREEGRAATTASDVFSFGIVLYELLTWQPPYQGINPHRIAMFVEEGGRPAVPDAADLPGADTPKFAGLPDYVALMERCWRQDAAERPSFAAIIPELRSLLQRLVNRGGGMPAPPPTPVHAPPPRQSAPSTPEASLHERLAC